MFASPRAATPTASAAVGEKRLVLTGNVSRSAATARHAWHRTPQKGETAMRASLYLQRIVALTVMAAWSVAVTLRERVAKGLFLCVIQ